MSYILDFYLLCDKNKRIHCILQYNDDRDKVEEEA